jgi:aflatoxin B1 aldehyde reductase
MVKVVVGLMGSSPGKGSQNLATAQQVASFLAVVKQHGVKEIDTARAYNSGRSEEVLGEVNAHQDFAIATKAPAFSPGSLAEEKIIDNCNKSLNAMGQGKVDLYYLHGPDTATPLSQQCKAIGTLYKEGKFDRFGISNIGPEAVQEVYDICKAQGYPLPTVYQGMYNPVARKGETTLFPLLRKLGIAFYAYSPVAGGLFAKPLDQILKPAAGSRFDQMPVFGQMFLKDETMTALRSLAAKCESTKDESGLSLSLMRATLRWMRHHSSLGEKDAVILGASTEQQIDASLSACEEGPLPAEIVQAFEDLWKECKDGAPPASF